MKFSKIASALFATVVLANTASAVTTVNGGVVHFEGELVNAPCVVNTQSADQTVVLGQYRTASFDRVGATSALVDFDIVLNDCDSTLAATASVAFSGNLDATDPTLLAISSGTNTTTATGVGIEIMDRTSTTLTPDGTDFSAAQTLIDGTNTLPFTARYKSTALATTAGQANADATFIMQYP